MTREEKVKNLLTELIDMIDNGSQRDLDKADEISTSIIKLFEQEPSGDLIRREDLIRHIENQSREWGEDYDAQQILGDIEDMPSVKPQEPSGDLISRQAVIDKLNRLIEVERLQGTDKMGYGRERVSAYESMIYEIESEYLYPSVKPQEPKIGHWIYDDEYSNYFDVTYRCSCCGREIITPYELKNNLYSDYPYCHCGTRMIAP